MVACSGMGRPLFKRGQMTQGNINISSDEITLTINSDPNRIIKFNPKDVAFAERFYILLGELKEKLEEFKKRSEQLELVKENNDLGVPVNFSERLQIINEACNYMKVKIDTVFAPGTSKTVFGDSNQIEAFEQFLNGLLPYFEKARAPILAQYTNRKVSKKKK